MYDQPNDFRSMVRARLGIKPNQQQQAPGLPQMPFNQGLFNKMGGASPGYLPWDHRVGMQIGGANLPVENPIGPPYSIPTPGQIGTPKSQIQPVGLPPDVSLPDPVGIGPDGPINKKSLYRQVF